MQPVFQLTDDFLLTFFGFDPFYCLDICKRRCKFLHAHALPACKALSQPLYFSKCDQNPPSFKQSFAATWMKCIRLDCAFTSCRTLSCGLQQALGGALIARWGALRFFFLFLQRSPARWISQHPRPRELTTSAFLLHPRFLVIAAMSGSAGFPRLLRFSENLKKGSLEVHQ